MTGKKRADNRLVCFMTVAVSLFHKWPPFQKSLAGADRSIVHPTRVTVSGVEGVGANGLSLLKRSDNCVHLVFNFTSPLNRHRKEDFGPFGKVIHELGKFRTNPSQSDKISHRRGGLPMVVGAFSAIYHFVFTPCCIVRC
jgi:hypothetical protein